MQFRLWIEEFNQNGIQNVIMDFLKDKLNIHNEEDILDLNTKDIDSSIISSMMERGILKNDISVEERIKNGITIKELIDFLSKET